MTSVVSFEFLKYNKRLFSSCKMQNKRIESGVHLFARIAQRPNLDRLNEVIFWNGGPYPAQLVEITGEPSTGKTMLVTDLLAKCILPICYKGKNSGAIIINTDHHFDLFKLISVMEYYLKKSGKSTSYKSIIEKSLDNLIVLNCYSSEQLEATFLNLETIILQNNNISLLVVDSIAAYYWLERGNSNLSFNAYYSQIISKLHGIAKQLNVSVIYTKPEIVKESSNRKEDCTIVLRSQENCSFKMDVLDNVNNTSKSLLYKINKTIEFTC